jgi:C1A family cysteine protease
MATNLTNGALRKILADGKATWTIDDELKDTDPIPQHGTGCDLTKVPKITNVERIDITAQLSIETSNVYLRQLRVNNGHLKPLPPELARVPSIAGAVPVPVGGTGVASSVDWRNRFGWPWLTNIKNQDPCESCWCFGAVGLVEAMTRIEHSIWSLRSEGDVHDGMGSKCADGGWPSNALDWMKTSGVADPGCWAYETQNLPYNPTPDRSGRTVRLDSYVTLNNIQDQKAWIDQVGPIVGCFTCYWDFQAYGPNSGVYICNPASGIDGGHCILVVGYDDVKEAWLIRNSWGNGWGMGGYCWFGYNQAAPGLDSNAKYGVLGASTNPDPWTKRRAHNGNLYESGDGAIHRNFEVWAQAPGNAIRHYWRDGNTLQWAVAETQGNDCAASPAVTGTTYNRNFEMVYRTTGNQLHHRWFDQASSTWGNGPVFGPTNVAGIPGFIQSDYGAPGNFELVVLLATGSLQHWWRNEANGQWQASATFGDNIALSAPTLVQRWDRGLDVICVNNDGTMQRYWRNDPQGMNWAAFEKFGSNVSSAPVMIRSQYGATNETTPGNYELCVAVNGEIQHWWTAGEQTAHWANSATFGTNVAGQQVKEVLGLIESSFGFDLEVVAMLTDGSLQHFWRDGAGWHAGPVFGSIVH